MDMEELRDRIRFRGVRIMKLSKLKRLLDDMFDERMYFVQRKCLLEDIVRDDGSATCGDCEYSCFNKCTEDIMYTGIVC